MIISCVLKEQEMFENSSSHPKPCAIDNDAADVTEVEVSLAYTYIFLSSCLDNEGIEGRRQFYVRRWLSQ